MHVILMALYDHRMRFDDWVTSSGFRVVEGVLYTILIQTLLILIHMNCASYLIECDISDLQITDIDTGRVGKNVHREGFVYSDVREFELTALLHFSTVI